MNRKIQVDPTRLTGFGVVGWIGLVVLAGLVGVAVSGFNPIVEAQRLVLVTLGVEAMFRATLFSMYLMLTWKGPTFSFVTLCVVLIGLAVQPRRVGWWWFAFLIFWTFARPVLIGFSGPGRLLPWWLQEPWLPAEWELYLVTVLLVALLTRWWVATAGAALLCLGGSVLLTAWPMMPQGVYITAGVVWNGGLLGLLLWWAIRERRRWRPDRHCYACGYDVRTITTGLCPECGEGVGMDGRPAAIAAALATAMITGIRTAGSFCGRLVSTAGGTRDGEHEDGASPGSGLPVV